MEGNREINELHVPVGSPVKLTMTTEGRAAQLLYPGVPHKATSFRVCTPALVRSDQGGRLSSVLRRILRHQHSGMIGKCTSWNRPIMKPGLPHQRRKPLEAAGSSYLKSSLFNTAT
ncbi:MAG: hypothetical protein QM736_03100 [Vicinamibacterales bacterium]